MSSRLISSIVRVQCSMFTVSVYVNVCHIPGLRWWERDYRKSITLVEQDMCGASSVLHFLPHDVYFLRRRHVCRKYMAYVCICRLLFYGSFLQAQSLARHSTSTAQYSEWNEEKSILFLAYVRSVSDKLDASDARKVMQWRQLGTSLVYLYIYKYMLVAYRLCTSRQKHFYDFMTCRQTN